MISGAFAIVSQSQNLGCFPRVKVYHTSIEYEGQVYIPEINYILMVLCVLVTLLFETTTKIGNAYGMYEGPTSFCKQYDKIDEKQYQNLLGH